MTEDNIKDYILVEGDSMEVSVVRTESDKPEIVEGSTGHQKHWRIATVILLCVLAVLLGLIGMRVYNRYTNIGVPISRQPSENIALLKKQMKAQSQGVSGVTHTSDSILGVAMDFYKLEGLRGTLSMQVPDVTDSTAFMYVRASDYLADGTMIGSTVVDGEEIPSTSGDRKGYVAMAGNGTVIGVSPSEKVRNFVQEEGGSFFRQFILVSNGVLPQRFYLHGKVERRALGRIGDTLFIITTRHKETMWDFADALREYGFVDAVYITGGDDRTFYRTQDGEVHEFGTDSVHTKEVPWLVFRSVR